MLFALAAILLAAILFALIHPHDQFSSPQD